MALKIPMLPTRARCMTKTLLFIAWRDVTIRTLREAFQAEIERLTELAGRQKESVWLMRKEQLVQVARVELDMPRFVAEKETVVTLRERIRRARALRERQEQPRDPQAALPKGLEKMSAQELIQECVRRGINPENTEMRGRRATKTRPEMIVAIRDHAAACQSRTGTSPPRARSASVKRRAPPAGEDPMQT